MSSSNFADEMTAENKKIIKELAALFKRSFEMQPKF